jgi:hypothetical protein
MAAGHRTCGRAVGALGAVWRLDVDRRQRRVDRWQRVKRCRFRRERLKFYIDLVLASVHDQARAALEALMASGSYEYKSDFARRYVAQGRTEGRAEAVIEVLTARGIAVPEDIRARILACSDLALLDSWLVRAATANALSEVVGA